MAATGRSLTISCAAGQRQDLSHVLRPRRERLWARRDSGLGPEYAASLHLRPDHRAILVGRFGGTSFLASRVVKPEGDGSTFVLNLALPSARDGDLE
jgi:hypothetical protein